MNSETIDLIVTLWVYGVTTSKIIAFSEGIELLPIEAMPPSEEKFYFQQSTVSIQSHTLPSPRVALIKRVTVPKVFSDKSNSDCSTAKSDLTEIATLMNALPDVCSMPGYETIYRAPAVPTYPFGGHSGGNSLFDVLPHQRFEFDPQFKEQLSQLHNKYKLRSNPTQRRLSAALHRLVQAKGRLDPNETCLDLGIALEMVLLNAEHKGRELPGQLHLHFRLRGSWLVGKSGAERRKIYKMLGEIYTFRSRVAHNGYSDELFSMPADARRLMLENHTRIAEKIIATLILEGTPPD